MLAQITCTDRCFHGFPKSPVETGSKGRATPYGLPPSPMAGAHCAAFSLLASLTNTTNTTPRLLKPLLSSSIPTQLPPKKLTKRRNHLRPKILKTLTKPLSTEPAIPIISPHESDTVSAPQPDEVPGIVPSVDEVEEIQVTETEGVAGEYSGSFGKLSAMSVLKIGLGLVGVFILQTICAVWFLGNSDSDEKNKNLDSLDKFMNGINKGNILVNESVVYLDKTELEYKVNEIRAMAREVRKIEENRRENGDEDGKKGIEKDISTRLSKLGKKLNEFKDVEDAKGEDSTLMFKKKFKFRSPSMSLGSDVKGFSGLEDSAMCKKKKKKSGKASANGDSRESISGTVEREKNANEALSRDSNSLQNKVENLENKQKEMGDGSTAKRFGTDEETSQWKSLVEVMRSRETRDTEVQSLQNFSKEKQEATMKSDKDAVLGRNSGSSANMVRDDQSLVNSDSWWLNLPYVLGILMCRGLDHENPGGLFTLRITSQVNDQSEIPYTVAFEDRGDANNFCYLLESFFEELGDFSADIVPLSVKELHGEVKSGMKKVIVVKKRQLKLYAGQPLADVEKALCSLVEQNSSTSTTNVR